MTIESWIAMVLALMVLGLSPGPAWAAVVTTSMGRGFTPAMIMSIGIALGDVVFLFFAAFGLNLLANALGALFLGVKFAGAAYLVWLGIGLWRRPPGIPEDPQPTGRGTMPLFAGFALTMGNPKVIAFYLGFLPAFVDLSSLTTVDLGVLAVTTFVVIASMLGGYAAIAARSRRLLRRERIRKIMGRVIGTTLIGTGVVVATR